MTPFVDPRVRMRDALRRLVQQEPPARDAASLALFRNRLLDETGSDARPLAELLLEAIRRGWLDALPTEPIASARWDALTSPFVMRWSAERFVQPEMARWAAESWAFALGSIPAEWLRIAPPQMAEPKAIASRDATAARAILNIAAGGTKPAAVASARTTPTFTRAPSVAPPAQKHANTRATNAIPSNRGTARARSTVPPLNPKFVRNIAILAASSYLFFIGYMAVSIRNSRAAETAATKAAASLAPLVFAPTERAPTSTPLPQPSPTVEAGTTTASVLSARMPNVASEIAPTAAGSTLPGVPSITRNALPGSSVDPARMLIVEPARRANGASLPPTATGLAPRRTDPIAYDEVLLTDGSRMTGRVDIIRAGEVIFRDMRSGLRHEIRKDDIAQIVTEFGTTVQFRTAEATSGVASAKLGASAARTVSGAIATGVRARGVPGRYTIQYDAAQAKGSKECTSVWTRTPQTVDHATVVHLPNADTLTIAFDGGDNFPSNIDQQGYFASTPRILPDQARTSTALVTRLTGQFSANGSLSLTVSIVFFRRMRTGPDLACTVYVNAKGNRDAP